VRHNPQVPLSNFLHHAWRVMVPNQKAPRCAGQTRVSQELGNRLPKIVRCRTISQSYYNQRQIGTTILTPFETPIMNTRSPRSLPCSILLWSTRNCEADALIGPGYRCLRGHADGRNDDFPVVLDSLKVESESDRLHASENIHGPRRIVQVVIGRVSLAPHSASRTILT
jgi:hypothetical protein